MTEQAKSQQSAQGTGGSLAELETELCALAGQIAAATSQFLRLLADFDQRKGWEGVNIRSCAHWLSWRCGLSIRTAHEQVRVARALTGLPLISEAFDAGRISYSKVRAIARVATSTSEPDLLSAALHAPAAHVERLARGLRTAQRGFEGVEGNSADDLGLKPLPKRPDSKRIGWHWDLDGDLVIAGRMSPEDGARLLAAVTRAQAETESRSPKEPKKETASMAETGSEKETGLEAETARKAASASWMKAPSDLGRGLTAMAEMVCAGLSAPIHAPGAEVQVTVDIDTLTKAFNMTSEPAPDAEPDANDDTEPAPGTGARIEDGPALTAACLRRLADDARISLAVLDAAGRTIGLGRSRRAPNRGQLRALWRRDHGCALPGCGRTRFLHAHHVVFWSRGGATDLTNMLLLCGEHHRDLHEGGFSIRALGQQSFEFTGRGGTLLDPAPTMAGSADELQQTFNGTEPGAIIPDWNGTPMPGWAIAGYLANWKNTISRGRARDAA